MFTPHHFIRIVSTMLLSLLLLAACAPEATPAPTVTPDSKQALIGSWTTTITKEDLVRIRPEFPQEHLCENAGTFLWKFNADGTFTIDQTALPDCTTLTNPHIEDVWVLDENQITFAKGTPDEEIYEITINGDKLTFKVVASECPPCIAINTANSWTRVE